MPLERMYRAARAARIYDGPDEVHRQTVARQTLQELHRRPRCRPSTCPTRRAAASEKFADLLDQVSLND